MIAWRPAVCERLAPAPAVLAVLEQAIAAHPENAVLLVKYADLKLDFFDYYAAAQYLEKALKLEPGHALAALRLSRCYNGLGRYGDALAALRADPQPRFERAVALLELDRASEAEAELRAVLADMPPHRHAAWKLFKLLRASGRTAEVLHICEALFQAGAAHSQLFYDWGRALALGGNLERARALLFDRSKVAALTLAVPEGFSDIAQFNSALADDLLANPTAIHSFPASEANRGSSRIHNLYAGGGRPLIRPLLNSLQQAVECYAASIPPVSGFDPWSASRPAEAHLRAWGLIQKGDAHEDWHLHRGGWLSGVYYVRIPEMVSERGRGPGCLEFGIPPKLADQFPELASSWRIAPREGMLLLSPSHYLHRTIPTGADEYRISLAFDVVPGE